MNLSPSSGSQSNRKLIVQKYGGATLATPEKIKKVALKIAETHRQGHSLVIAVSAMGQTTDQLIQLARQVSDHPNRRELDMLLTTGERISMALLSMALLDLKIPAISFTGSQAGILTNESHVNAFIKDVKPIRVEEALKQNKVVILAGFQGVSSLTKEITTLGRGGTDTTAVAMAAALKAERCEILKDIDSVFTADPKKFPLAKPIPYLSFSQMAEMTFWGAKVLHYRSVELAERLKVPIYVGPASNTGSIGTIIGEKNMYESEKILGLNQHSKVLHLQCESYAEFVASLTNSEIANPLVLQIEILRNESHFSTSIWITGPREILTQIEELSNTSKTIKLVDSEICTLTATCSGASSLDLQNQMMDQLQKNSIVPSKMIISGQSISFFLTQKQLDEATKLLHLMIESQSN